MDTETIVSLLEKDNFIHIVQSSLSLSDMREINTVHWEGIDWHYGTYHSINGQKIEGVRAIPIIDYIPYRIYGWKRPDMIEEHVKINSDSELAIILVSDCEKKIIKMKLKL